MLNHQLNSKILNPFPADYLIIKNLIDKQKQIKTCDFDERFISVFDEICFDISSKIVFNERIIAKEIKRETRIIISKGELDKRTSTYKNRFKKLRV